ncbi:hypothetical protein [Parasphingorhabdus sp.]|uniref:hypothetical protein n=1 Tax=Parasphingorhabdus sp. TaxID=2709688 RepID=UPI003264D52F
MQKTITIEIKKGEVLQIVAPESREDGKKAQQAYYQSVFPIAETLGYKRLAQMNVKQKVVSEYDPAALIFYSWPNKEAERWLYGHPKWPSLKASRPDAWSELKIYTETVQKDLTLRFDPTKYYSVVVAWFNAENPGDYERYLDGIAPAVERFGGRFIYKMRNPSFEAHASAAIAPGQITFVEWDKPDGFQRVQKSDEYKKHSKYFGTGLERFEFYWLEPKV